MLTKLTVENFKRFEKFEIELGSSVLFVGPNNSGKTSALQALALWETGVKAWYVKRGTSSQRKKPTGVALNRTVILPIPVPELRLLWHQLRVRSVKKVKGKNVQKNIPIRITAEGEDKEGKWSCGMEFSYAGSEILYCRPIVSGDQDEGQPVIPLCALNVNMALLPPMSGLVADEDSIETGTVNVRIGQGQTAEILRNICYQVFTKTPESWEKIVEKIREIFGVTLNPPEHLDHLGQITMAYREQGDSKLKLDLSSAGRGMLQTLLILGYMYSRPGAVLLFDEPDAHLEILRQREIYQHIAETALETGGQFIAASHSEVLLDESARRDDTLIFFIGKKPKQVDKPAQVIKSLKDYGLEDYYQAEQKGWILYLEGSTDLSILKAFAKKLDHKEAQEALDNTFFKPVGSNDPAFPQRHFYAMAEAYDNGHKKFRGAALFDRLPENKLPASDKSIQYLEWQQREIENYFCFRETLVNWIKAMERQDDTPPLLQSLSVYKMEKQIDRMEQALKVLNEESPWGEDMKVSTEFLEPLFNNLGLSKIIRKSNFHQLVEHIPDELISPEVTEKLDAIVEVYSSRNDPEA
ncbi:MAG: AAA family ATPase [Gammaproteobacteria bacterium AqS3]|nr:AAA family ATPase [Gammaproteobacteria bacterium AqS3]